MHGATMRTDERGRSPEPIDGSCRPTVRSGVTSVVVDGEAVVLDEVTGDLHLLNPVAAAVFQCFDGTGTLDEIVADLSAAFGVDAGVIREDVVALLHRLTGARLVVDATPADG